MFDSKIYTGRRNRLKGQVMSGLILFLGNEESPMNYQDNPYHFRQDSSFLYFFGLDSPRLAAVIDIDENKDIIFGDDVDAPPRALIAALRSINDDSSGGPNRDR